MQRVRDALISNVTWAALCSLHSFQLQTVPLNIPQPPPPGRSQWPRGLRLHNIIWSLGRSDRRFESRLRHGRFFSSIHHHWLVTLTSTRKCSQALMMEAVHTSETSVYFKDITQRSILESCHLRPTRLSSPPSLMNCTTILAVGTGARESVPSNMHIYQTIQCGEREWVELYLRVPIRLHDVVLRYRYL
jgi:hypothetical protein